MGVLRSSVIQANCKDASPAKCRRKEGENENRGCWMEGDFIELRTETHTDKERLIKPNRKQLSSNIRYGVVANIAVSHTAAGGSIPPIGVFFLSFEFFFNYFVRIQMRLQRSIMF